MKLTDESGGDLICLVDGSVTTPATNPSSQVSQGGTGQHQANKRLRPSPNTTSTVFAAHVINLASSLCFHPTHGGMVHTSSDNATRRLYAVLLTRIDDVLPLSAVPGSPAAPHQGLPTHRIEVLSEANLDGLGYERDRTKRRREAEATVVTV